MGHRTGHQVPLTFLACTATALVSLMIRPGDATGQSNIFASGCTGQELKLQCPPQHFIAIKRVFYGVKRSLECGPNRRLGQLQDQVTRSTNSSQPPSDCCRATHVDCQMDLDSIYPTLNTKCSGYPSCQLEVQKVPTREPCRFKSYTDYMTIVYDCISDADIARFCSDEHKRGQSLYLANREYPGTIRSKPGGEECQCLIRTTDPEGISIHAIDVLLAWADLGPMECWRSLKIQDPMSYHKDIKCAHRGYYGFKSIYSRPVANVSVALSSKSGDGMAFVWLQAKTNDADGTVEALCGQPLQDLLNRLRHQSESRHRESTPTTELGTGGDRSDKTGLDEDQRTNGTNVNLRNGPHSLNSDLAAIVGGIVAAGFVLIAMVIIAMALHCRRIRKEKRSTQPLELYPAVNSEPLDLSSYCRYDYDDDHLCTISRSPIKMTARTDEGPVANSFRPNGFTTISRPEEYQIHRGHSPSPPLPPGISTPPPSIQSHTLLPGRAYREVHYPGDMSLRFVKPLINNGHNITPVTVDIQGEGEQSPHPQGHTTLPANRKAVLISCGPKSPLGKRSKSVTFSQPVAMVTPLNSESEESVAKQDASMAFDTSQDPSYDNLNKLHIPDYPVIPGKADLDTPDFPFIHEKTDYEVPQYSVIKRKTDRDLPDFSFTKGKTELIHIPDKEFQEETCFLRPLSTFQNDVVLDDESQSFITPDLDLRLNFDTDEAFQITKSSDFWSPTRHNGKPLVLPRPQKAEVYDAASLDLYGTDF